MAASRRSPLMQHRWRDRDDCHRGHRDHRAHELDRRRPQSPLPNRRGEGGQDLDFGNKLIDDTDQSFNKTAKHVRSSYADISKHRPHFQQSSERPRGIENEDRGVDRDRGRDFSLQAGRARSITPEQNRPYSHHERRQERRYKHTAKVVSPARRHRYRRHSPFSPHRERYFAPTNPEHSRQDWHNREVYTSTSRRGRSRSPVTLDHYRPENLRRPSTSPDRYNRRQSFQYHQNHGIAEESLQQTYNSSPPVRAHHERSRPVTPEKPSKSSRRSEKQKQRTLRHLRLKNKTNEFLRSISPPRKGAHLEDQRMQQSTRPIQSILDEPSRQPSPPRPIPSFDDTSGSTDSQIREQFPLHGMKATDMHPSHRRIPTHIDTRQQYASSPQYMTPTSSHHASPPHSASPYSQGRGGWGGQHYINQWVHVPSSFTDGGPLD